MNKVILIGRTTKNPELQYAAGSGTAICKFNIAVNRRKQEGKEQEADFINCVAFGKTGETIAQYISKGQQVALIGRIQTGNYEDKEGIKRYTTDIMVESFEFIGNSKKVNSNNDDNSNNDFTPVDYGETPF